MTLVRPTAGLAPRLGVLVVSLLLVAGGVTLLLTAELGAAPFDVLTTGLAEGTGIPLWISAVLVPAACVAGGLALGERAGVGTAVALVTVGPILGVLLPLMPDVAPMPARIALFGAGLVLATCGITGVVAAEAGTGPAEMLMVGLAARGIRIDVVRLGLEVTFVALGALLGGAVGVGTLVFAVAIGPLLRRTLAVVGWQPRARPLPPV